MTQAKIIDSKEEISKLLGNADFFNMIKNYLEKKNIKISSNEINKDMKDCMKNENNIINTNKDKSKDEEKQNLNNNINISNKSENNQIVDVIREE